MFFEHMFDNGVFEHDCMTIQLEGKRKKKKPLIPLMNEGLGELKCRRHFFNIKREQIALFPKLLMDCSSYYRPICFDADTVSFRPSG